MDTASDTRTYQQTHPWISFSADLRHLRHTTWILLGEAEAYCTSLAGAALRPSLANQMHEITLSKGIHGTTSIEGNTLSEDEVLERVRGRLPLPDSREYLGKEVDNVLGLYNEIVDDVLNDRPLALTTTRLNHFNRTILDGLPLREGVIPGVVREHSVAVAGYRGAPPEDLEYLLDRLCTWLQEMRVEGDGPTNFSISLARAILAHLYLAWIHPYGDGNGRVARVVEFLLLIDAGLPTPAVHLLSDHYNKTRDAYYRALDRTSKGQFPIEEFVEYAVQGFVDELREQMKRLNEHQLDVTWQNFVHDSFRGQETAAKVRQKHLVLDLPSDEPVLVSEVRRLSARMGEEYAGKQQKTVTRDLNELERMELIIRVGRNGRMVLANRGSIRAFLPIRSKRSGGDA